MKRLIFFCSFYLYLSGIQSQVLLKTQIPLTGLVLKSQLWNLSVVNTSPQSMMVKIEMLLTNVSNNQKIMSGITKAILLPTGTFQVTPSNAIPISYNVLSSDYNLNINQEGFLPVGAFNVCYTVIGLNHDSESALTEECETVEIEPISPPMLVNPGDREFVDVLRPVFNWLPPNPVSLFNALSYDFILVDVQRTQSPSVAVQQNLPLYSQQNVSLTSLQYPLSLPELDTSKTYAWQIAARSGQQLIAKSEVWVFNIKKNRSEAVLKPVADYYMKLKKEMDASFAVCYGLLKFSYVNEINDKTVSIRIADITTAKQHELKLDSSIMGVEYGENFKQLDLSTQTSLKDKHTYLLDLKNSNEEHWYIKFEYRKSTSKN